MQVTAITKRMILLKNVKLLFVLQLLCILNGKKIYTNNTLVMLKFSSISVPPLNNYSDTITAPAQLCFGGKMLSTFKHSCMAK